VVAGDGSPVLSSDGEMVYKGHHDEKMSNPWSMLSITYWRDAEECLEGLWSSGASAGDGPAQIRMQSTVNSCRGNAPEHGEDKGTEKRRQGHLGASESMMHADSAAAHRR
jgi:hypothetical protein